MNKKNGIFSSMFKKDKRKEEIIDINEKNINSITDIKFDNSESSMNDRYNNEDMLKFIQNYDKKKAESEFLDSFSSVSEVQDVNELLDIASMKEELSLENNEHKVEEKKEEEFNKEDDYKDILLAYDEADVISNDIIEENKIENIAQAFDSEAVEKVSVEEVDAELELEKAIASIETAFLDVNKNEDIDKEQPLLNISSYDNDTSHLENNLNDFAKVMEVYDINNYNQEDNKDSSDLEEIETIVKNDISEEKEEVEDISFFDIENADNDAVESDSMQVILKEDIDEEEKIRRIREKKKRRKERKKEKIRKMIENSKKEDLKSTLNCERTEDSGYSDKIAALENELFNKNDEISKLKSIISDGKEQINIISKEKQEILDKLIEERQSCENIIKNNEKTIDETSKELSRLMSKFKESKKLLLEKDETIDKISREKDDMIAKQNEEIENLKSKVSEIDSRAFATADIASYKFDPVKYSKNYDVNNAMRNYSANPKLAIELLKDTAIYSRNNKDYMVSYVALKKLVENKEELATIVKEIEIAKAKQRLELDRFINAINLDKNRL